MEEDVRKLSPNAKQLQALDIREKESLAYRLGITVGYLNRFARGEFTPRYKVGDAKSLAAKMERAGYPLEDWIAK